MTQDVDLSCVYVLGTVGLNEILEALQHWFEMVVLLVFVSWGIQNVFLLAPVTLGLYWH